MRFAVVLVLSACGGSAVVDTPKDPAPKPRDNEDKFGPLEVGADYATSFRKVSDAPFRSLDHGNRFVEVYVNEIGAAAYLGDADIPAGTIVVKPSWLNIDGKMSDIPGPIFVMEKRAGYDSEHGDWWYAIHWADPPAEDAKKFGGPIYWRGKSSRVAYCWGCHDDYDRNLGGLVPSSVLPR